LLREEVLPALRLTVKAAAENLGVSRQTLHAILAERSAVTPEMAVRLGKLCGDGPGIWLRMQMAHDLWQARRDLAETVKQIPTLHAV
jgi:addiction module HigA family antidote